MGELRGDLALCNHPAKRSYLPQIPFQESACRTAAGRHGGLAEGSPLIVSEGSLLLPELPREVPGSCFADEGIKAAAPVDQRDTGGGGGSGVPAFVPSGLLLGPAGHRKTASGDFDEVFPPQSSDAHAFVQEDAAGCPAGLCGSIWTAGFGGIR